MNEFFLSKKDLFLPEPRDSLINKQFHLNFLIS